MKQLHVMRITPHFYRPGLWPVGYDPVGGLQRQLWKLTEGLSFAHISQTVITSYIPGSPRLSAPFPLTTVRSVGASLPQRLADRLLNFSWSLGVVRQLILSRSRGDVVHLHFNHSIWCRVIALCLRATQKPVVISLNTALGGAFERLALMSRYMDLRDWIERLALARAQCIIALTHKDAERIALLAGVDPSRVVVIPDAIDESEFRSGTDARDLDVFIKHHDIPSAATVVCYIGRISAEKGWQDFAPLLKTLAPDSFLLVCGDGRDRAKLEADLRATGLENWRITGFLSPHEIRIALWITTVLILPSRREAFGSVLLEAMAAGVPAVAYAVGGVVEVAGTPAAISLVPCDDQAAFARQVFRILTDSQQREILIERGRKRVQNFSLTSCIEKTLHVYRSVYAQGDIGTRNELDAFKDQSVDGCV